MSRIVDPNLRETFVAFLCGETK